MASSIFSFLAIKKKARPFNRPSTARFVDTSHGRDAAIAFERGETEEQRERAIRYLQADIKAAECDQKVVNRGALRAKAPHDDGGGGDVFWETRPVTPTPGQPTVEDLVGRGFVGRDWGSSISFSSFSISDGDEDGDGNGSRYSIERRPHTPKSSEGDAPSSRSSQIDSRSIVSDQSMAFWVASQSYRDQKPAAASSPVGKRDSLVLHMERINEGSEGKENWRSAPGTEKERQILGNKKVEVYKTP